MDVGVHPDIDMAEYYADPAPEASLTQTLAKAILRESPLHAWTKSPRLNTQYVPDNESRFDLANIAHALLLGRGRDVTVIEANDWRTNAAKQQRDACLAAGGIPVLPKMMARATSMVNVARGFLGDVGIRWDGKSEVGLLWHDPVQIHGTAAKRLIWCRSLIDRLTDQYVIDYKTTEGSGHPHALQTKFVSDGWDVQAAMHQWGLSTLRPKERKRRPLFLVQQVMAPYACTLVELNEAAVHCASHKLRRAAGIWARCLMDDRWPGYANGKAIELDYPDWAKREFDELMADA